MNKPGLVTLACTFAALLAITLAVTKLAPFSDARSDLQTRYVPTGLLDYGEKGKILKAMGFVYEVNNDFTRYRPVPPAAGQPGLFRRKREVNGQLYVANPGSIYKLPSTLAVDAAAHGRLWRLVSVVVDPSTLSDPYNGIVNAAVPGGVNEERRATVSFYAGGRLQAAANAAIKVHGTRAERMRVSGRIDQSYRLLLRRIHGIETLVLDRMFGATGSRIKRLVLTPGTGFRNELAMDIFERVGAAVPYRSPVLFYLNGQDNGVYTLREHVSPRQWKTRLGHDDFLLYRHRGTSDESTTQRYDALRKWYRENRRWIDEKMAASRIDVKSLTRNLIAAMFCADDDFQQGAAMLVTSDSGSGWQWISWDLGDSFGRRNLTMDSDQGVQPGSLSHVVSLDRTSSFWNARRIGLRPQLFARLLNNSASYRSRFLREVNDVLNHELTDQFLLGRYNYYAGLLEAREAAVPSAAAAAFGQIGEFLKARSDHFRREVKDTFDIGGIYSVSVTAPEGRRLLVDGYPKTGNYSGRYFEGQDVTVAVSAKDGLESGLWSVNGESTAGNSIRVEIVSDTEIQLLPPGE